MACGMSSSRGNFDIERKRELDRRKKLRLVQVRQQSKDFAKTLRENVKAEELIQRHKYLECRRKQIQQQQTEELKRLQKLYQACLQDVGSSHREAAKQPNVSLIKQAELAKGLALAAERGAEARRLHKENQVLQLQKIEAPIVKKQNTRKRENLRSFFVASLPKPAFEPRRQPTDLPQLSNNITPCKRQKQVVQNLPSNLLSQQPTCQKLCADENALKDISGDVNLEGDRQFCTENKQANELCRPVQEQNYSNSSLLRECSCDYIVCCCHNSSTGLRRSRSESVLGSEHRTEVQDTTSKRVKTRSRSCSPRSVRTLNYCDAGNLYESNQENFTRVTRHTSPLRAQEENTDCVSKYLSSEKKVTPAELKQKTEKRSLKAVQREQLKKDFKQLLQDLGNLSRERANLRIKKKSKTGVYQRPREVILKKESKQRKLAAAFETLIHTSAKPTLTKNTDIHQLSDHQQTEEEPSVPSLNLALYQEVNMYQGCSPSQPASMTRIQTCEELTYSQSPPSQSVVSHRSRSPVRSTRSICPPGNSSPGKSSPESSPGRSPCSQVIRGHGGSPRRNQPYQAQMFQEPADNLQINVKLKGHKKKCKKHPDRHTLDSSTSYYSPPENLTPSEQLLLDTLLIKIHAKGLNADLKKYIKKLLSMSRESIDDLNISSCSDYADPIRGSPEKELEEDYAMLGNLTRLYADQVDTLVNLFEECDDICNNVSNSDQFYSPPAPTLHGPSPEDQVQLGQFPYFPESPPQQLCAPNFSPIEWPDEQYIPSETIGRRDATQSRIPPPKSWPGYKTSQLHNIETPVRRPKDSRHMQCHKKENIRFPRSPRKPTTLPMQRRSKPCPPSQLSRPESRERPTSTPCPQSSRPQSRERRTIPSPRPCPPSSRTQSRERRNLQATSPCPQASRPKSREGHTVQAPSPCPQSSRSQSRERRTTQSPSPCPQASRSQSREQRTRQAQTPCPLASRSQSRERTTKQTPSPCPQYRERTQIPRGPCPSPSSRSALKPVEPDSVQSRIPHFKTPHRTPESPQMSTEHRPVQVQTPFGLSSNLLPHPRDVFGQQQDPCSPQLAPISESPERQKNSSPNSASGCPGEGDSSFDPFHNLPVRPESIDGSFLQGLLDTDDSFDYANFDEEAEMKKHGLDGCFSHIKIMLDEIKAEKQRNNDCGNQPSTFGISKDERPSKPCESLLEGITPLVDSDSDLKSANSSAGCSSSEDTVCKDVGSDNSSQNMCNINQCLSQATYDHHQKLLKIIDNGSNKEKDRISTEIWNSNQESLNDRDKFNKTKSLALLQALQIEF